MKGKRCSVLVSEAMLSECRCGCGWSRCWFQVVFSPSDESGQTRDGWTDLGVRAASGAPL